MVQVQGLMAERRIRALLSYLFSGDFDGSHQDPRSGLGHFGL